LTTHCQEAELNNISSTEYHRYIGGYNMGLNPFH